MKKNKKIIKCYNILGEAFCACAGGIVGFVIGGPILGLAGVFIGSISGHFLQRAVAQS
jgi:hypothetical protein